MTITLNLKPQRNALLRGFDNEFYGLLEVKHTQQGQQNSPGKSLNFESESLIISNFAIVIG